MNKSSNHLEWKDCESLELYVLGGLSEEETKEFEKHLLSCSDCQQEVQEYREIVELLPHSAELAQVPSGMKQRVLSHVLNQEEQKGSKISFLGRGRGISIVLAAAVLFLSFYSITLHQQIKELEGELVAIQTPAKQPKEMSSVVELNPMAEEVVAQGLATIVIDSRGTHLIVQAEKLPELQGTEAYQVWLLKDGNPVSAGTFLTHQGTGALYFTFEPQDYDTIAITMEPDALGDAPRGPIILAAPLKNNS